MKYVLVAMVCLALAGPVSASQEGALPIAEIAITWEGGEGWGPIMASGSRNPDGSLQRFAVMAFDRTIELPAPILAELSRIRFNGVLLSAETGYPELGGRTAYLHFVVGFTSGVVDSVIVAVDEGGNARILPARGDARRQ